MWHRNGSFICISAVRIIFIFCILKSLSLLSLLIAIDWSWHSRFSLTPFWSKEYEFLSTLVIVWPGITNYSLSSERIIGNSVLWYLLKSSLRKQPTSREVATWALAKRRLSNERRNSILMTCHYPDLGSAFDWLKRNSLDLKCEYVKICTLADTT